MIISSLSVSCVSKKKFEELARAKRELDRNLLELKRDKKQLEDQLQLAKDDFNTIRYKLTENNAVKDKTIDQLYTKLRSLESKQVELKSIFSFLTVGYFRFFFLLYPTKTRPEKNTMMATTLSTFTKYNGNFACIGISASVKPKPSGGVNVSLKM